MKRLLIALAGMLLTSCAGAQVKQPTAVVEKFAATITPAGVKKQLEIIAGREMEGRETATRGQERAAAYIISQFKAAGLQPGGNGGWEQYYPLYTDSLLGSTITAGDKVFRFGEDFYADVKSSRNVDTTVQEVVFAGYGLVTDTRNDYAGLDVKGKVVIIREGVPTGVPRDKGYLTTKLKTASALGVQSLLIVSAMADKYRMLDQHQIRKTGIYTLKDTTRNINVYFIMPAIAAAIYGGVQSDSLTEVMSKGNELYASVRNKLSLSFRKKEINMQPSNVLGYLEGTDKKDEVVFITAHYDHLGTIKDQIYYGADDDGSGTSAVIELAAAFGRAKKAGNSPRRSIVFMTVSGEEKGLLGSAYYTSHPVYPLEKTVADLNIDMIGRIDPAHEKDTNYVYIIGDNKLSSELRPINEKANAMHARLKLDYKYNDPNDPQGFYYRSDHYMFAQHNIPIIFYFNGTHADYHKPTDTVEKINFPLLARRARLVFFTAWEIANREGRLVVDRHER
ncbi:MAG TPA: M28 family peptidase [Chitinophaga sp.]|uniref:M28 family peptidase n=1 Tax=Chitinophaga sp. TaxID=1869181 RepID=UPI002CAB3302|nr:M28 family peptidase [Chitinophaga sp.]HVI44537.1 M28 family peptidase [Chitinophaga sp.]